MLENVDFSGIETLLLDRDGVINVLRPNDYVKCWDEFVFKEDFLDFISKNSWKFKHIFVVTNQRCVGRGIISEMQLAEIHSKMNEKILKCGGRIDKIYCSFAVDSSASDRKPQTGMFLQIQRDFADVKQDACMMIGDSESDMLFAKNCGIKGILV